MSGLDILLGRMTTHFYLLAICSLLVAHYFRAERERIEGTFPSALGLLFLLIAAVLVVIGSIS